MMTDSKQEPQFEAITGLPTGFVELDHKTKGLQPGDLIIVAARPSMGKTSFSVNIAANVALKSNLPVAIFSLEGNGTELAMRMIGAVGGINMQVLSRGNLEGDDWIKLADSLGKLNPAPIYIDETADLDVTEIGNRSHKIIKQNGGLSLIIIDYLQLINHMAMKQNESCSTNSSEITRALKTLATDLRVPIVLLSQLRRDVDQRQDKRPLLSDIGSIEQDADLAIVIYREEYYSNNLSDKGKTELIIRKNRNGMIGSVPMVFLAECGRFENNAPEQGD